MLQKDDDELVKVDEKSLGVVNDSLCNKELHEKDELIAKCTRYPERVAISEDIELFEKTISKLTEIKDPKILEKLMDNFSDNCEFPEAMYNLIYDIEAYPNDMYVTTILSKLKDLCYNFECFKVIIYEIINDQECLEILKKNLRLTDKKQLLKILNIIDNKSGSHHLIVKEIKQELEQLT